MSDNPYRDSKAHRQNNPIDEVIRDAMRKGEFENLPGMGKPLQLDDESNVPAELRLAHRLLKQNDLTPEWILIGKEIDASHESAVQHLRAALRAYRGRMWDAASSNEPELARSLAEADWLSAREEFRAAIATVNRKLLTYNLKLPPGFPRRGLLVADRELERCMR
jgi:DnaJ family protein C protein 28